MKDNEPDDVRGIRRIAEKMKKKLNRSSGPDNDKKRVLPESLTRLLLVFVILIGGGLALVKFIVPPSLKDTKIQWAESEKREKAKKINYAGQSACAECHEEQYDAKRKGFHMNLSCETCHGPGASHIEDPDNVTPTAPRERKFCPLCHTYNASRPRGFPQINPAGHNPMKPCFKCHDPHDPKPPTVPKECSACHGEIARTKAVSHHVGLKCITCHRTPSMHKVSPRSNRPTKPKKREFCGRCHSKSSSVKGPPKINLTTHGEKYLCWQCHYPHLPEVE